MTFLTDTKTMEKQHSAEFFAFFLENLKLLCKSHLCFDQVVEVSGYVCLELDHCRKERYFLSELIQNSGTVASASCCTQVIKSKESVIGDYEITGTEAHGASLLNCAHVVADNVDVINGNSAFGSRDDNVDTAESLNLSMSNRQDNVRSQRESSEFTDVDLHRVKQEVKVDSIGNQAEVSFPNTFFHHDSDKVLQLKERIQAISNAKMAVPWFGTPLIHSVRKQNSPERSQSSQHPCTSVSHSALTPFQINASGLETYQTSQTSSTMQTSSNTNPLLPVQTGTHMFVSDSMVHTADTSFRTNFPYPQMNYKLPSVLSPPSRQSRNRKGAPTYRVRQNWRYAVRQFENFLRFKGLEVVPIYTIPPIQLDGMLCEFIRWVKKSNGEDFHPWSVKNFFYHLEYHLKEFGYTSSITKGVEFKNSREVLRQKVNTLESRLHEAAQTL